MNFLDRTLHSIERHPASDRVLLRIALFVLLGCVLWTLFVVNERFTTEVPTPGGTFTEGIVGIPRFINPVLAFTRADQDMTTLLYSGLLRFTPDGTLVPDSAEDITISEDGRTYTINLKRTLRFHDGTPLTARDVVFTYQLIQEPNLKSPLQGNWSNVVVEALDEYTLTVTLEEPYAPFIENFTVGILPAHLWSDLAIEQIPFSQLNTEPVGSGPFQIQSASRDAGGLVKEYELIRTNTFPRDVTLDGLTIRFFTDEASLEQALIDNTLDNTSYADAADIAALRTNHGFTEQQAALPRLFAIFFNQNRSAILRDEAVREALDIMIDRNELIAEGAFGQGTARSGPLPVHLASTTVSTTERASSSLERATAVLEAADWEINAAGLWEKEIDDTVQVLRVTLRSSNQPVFTRSIEYIARAWRELGVEVGVEQFEQTGLVQSVIRPRDFEALLFGIDVGYSGDLYPYWHSSQLNDPGLNIAQYTNRTVDELLERTRTEHDATTRRATYQEAGAIIATERPAIFLFQPTISYLAREDVRLSLADTVRNPADRFSSITTWHTNTDRLWPWFSDRY